MKISERQKNILNELINKNDEYQTASILAKSFDVSLRTMQNDLAVIKKYVSEFSFWQYDAIPAKGSRIIIIDENEYMKFLDNENIETETLNSKYYRVKNIIAILICSKKSISLGHLEDRLFISRSTLLSDLKECEKLLKKYFLTIEIKQGQVSVLGNEDDIRRIILKENIDLLALNPYNPQKIMIRGSYFDKISKILTNVFMEYHYNVSDVYLQNFIVHIDIMINRIQMGFFIETNDNYEEDPESKEMKIANRLFAEFAKNFNIPASVNEIKRLCVYLKSRSAYIEDSYITKEIDTFVEEGLTLVKEKQGVDFLSDIWLRNSLALHMVPLLTRLKYNMQLKNMILEDIRIEYREAFDYAALFSYKILEHYGFYLSEDELSFIAMYFQYALEKQEENYGSKNVLVISSLKRSETLLLRERIKLWFDNYINSMEIINPYELDKVNFKDYDLICSTEKLEDIKEDITYISHFPTKNDYRKMRLILDGFKDVDELIDLFKFMDIDVSNRQKEDILKEMVDRIDDKSASDIIFEEIKKRESIGGSYMGNYIATPHPMTLVSNINSVIVAFLSDAICWDDEKHKVKIIILVNLKKGNSGTFRIWSYLSELINDENAVNQLLAEMTDQNFKAIFKEEIDCMFDKLRK